MNQSNKCFHVELPYKDILPNLQNTSLVHTSVNRITLTHDIFSNHSGTSLGSFLGRKFDFFHHSHLPLSMRCWYKTNSPGNYTLLQKKCKFSGPIFPGDPGSLTLQSLSIYNLSKNKRNFPCCFSFEGECTTCHITHEN